MYNRSVAKLAESPKGYCMKCGHKVSIKDSVRYIWKNRRSRSGRVMTWKGKCPDCDTTVYKVIGHI